MHRFCWADLATTDDTQAASFYTALFGWSTRTYVIAHGRFDTLSRGDVEFASIYRLARELDNTRSRLAAESESTGSELSALREERDLIRSRVAEMLEQLEAI